MITNSRYSLILASLTILVGLFSPLSAQTFTFTQRVPAGPYGNPAAISLKTERTHNPGPGALDIFIPNKRFTVKKDEKGVLVSIQSEYRSLHLEEPTEKWALQDPNAFTVVLTEADGSVVRKTTLASIKLNGVQTIVMQGKYYGKTLREQNGQLIKHGEITRTEYVVPKPLFSVMTRGTVIDGGFHSTTRSTLIRLINERTHKIRRDIKESRSGLDEKWKVDSDVLLETKKLGGNMREIRRVEFPDGEALTEKWDYYSPGEITGPDGSTAKVHELKTHHHADGTTVTTLYEEGKHTVETRRPGRPVERMIHTAESFPFGISEQTKIWQVGEKETLRKFYRYEPTKTTTTTTRNGGEEETLIEEFYPGGKMFGGKNRRTLYPDGTITTWDWTELEDGKVRLVRESGTGDGTKVTKGTRTTQIFSKQLKMLDSKTTRISLK